MKYFLLLLLVASMQAPAAEFEGCGEYDFRGVLKADEKSPFKMVFVIHSESRSEMKFYPLEKDDAVKLGLMIDLPVKMKANITKMMDGTKGSLTFPTDISRRMPDPLKSNDTGIKKIKSFKCD